MLVRGRFCKNQNKRVVGIGSCDWIQIPESRSASSSSSSYSSGHSQEKALNNNKEEKENKKGGIQQGGGQGGGGKTKYCHTHGCQHTHAGGLHATIQTPSLIAHTHVIPVSHNDRCTHATLVLSQSHTHISCLTHVSQYPPVASHTVASHHYSPAWDVPALPAMPLLSKSISSASSSPSRMRLHMVTYRTGDTSCTMSCNLCSMRSRLHRVDSPKRS